MKKGDKNKKARGRRASQGKEEPIFLKGLAKPKGSPVRRVAKRPSKNSKDENILPPLVSLWANEAAGKTEAIPLDGNVRNTHKGPRAVVSNAERNQMHKKTKPLLVNGNGADSDEEKEDVVAKYKKMKPARARLGSSAAARNTPYRSDVFASIKQRNSRIGSINEAEKKNALLPPDFDYDITMYNSPDSRGMLVGEHEVRLIPHPCTPVHDERWKMYCTGKRVEPEIPPETTIDFLSPSFDPNDVKNAQDKPPPVAPRTPVVKRRVRTERAISSSGPPPVPPPRNMPQTPALPERRPEERKSQKVDEKNALSALKKSDSVKALHKQKKP